MNLPTNNEESDEDRDDKDNEDIDSDMVEVTHEDNETAEAEAEKAKKVPAWRKQQKKKGGKKAGGAGGGKPKTKGGKKKDATKPAEETTGDSTTAQGSDHTVSPLTFINGDRSYLTFSQTNKASDETPVQNSRHKSKAGRKVIGYFLFKKIQIVEFWFLFFPLSLGLLFLLFAHSGPNFWPNSGWSSCLHCFC